MRSRLLGLVAALTLLTTVSASALPGLGGEKTTPVMCKPGDVTPDGRVFPEPEMSATFLSFTDFECGVFLLQSMHANLVEVTTLGNSASGHPIYDVRVTNEDIRASEKQHLMIMSSIHGNEMAGREGAARVIEDMVDARFMNQEAFIQATLDGFVTHFVFPNPDGWINGDISTRSDSGVNYTRGNNNNGAGTGPASGTIGGRDLNRNFPILGFLRASNGTQDTPEGRAVNQLLLEHADPSGGIDDPDYRGWSYGTDNHGQGQKSVAASGLQIVGEFDYQKSERLAHFADAITPAMEEFGAMDDIETLESVTGEIMEPYEWGTLYDILGYSASGSGIDYYNTPGVINGTGFATEMTLANNPASNILTHPGVINQMWVNTTRAINYSLMRDAVDPPDFTYPVGGRAAYVFDPARVTSNDANGMGDGNAPESVPANFTGDRDPGTFRPYSVSRMKFFSDLNRYADRRLDQVSVPEVLDGSVDLGQYDSVVLNDSVMPEGDLASDYPGWVSRLRAFVEGGGNLIVTDAAAPILSDLFPTITADDVTVRNADVGYADFVGDSHLNEGLRGVASQTYDVIPIGIPDGGAAAPNWRVAQSAWDAQPGAITAGTNGAGQTVYGEAPLGAGKVSFLGALLPQPTEEFFHPYGLQNYAVTYTGYTLLENMLDYQRP